MSEILDEVYKANEYVCSLIEKKEILGRGLLSSTIIKDLRHFVEHLTMYEYECDNNVILTNEWPDIKKIGESYFFERGNLKFLKNFYECLEISISHYTTDDKESERLMLKYVDYLYEIRDYFKKQRSLNLLYNLDEFPMNLDKGMEEYYKSIANEIELAPNYSKLGNRYYIQRKTSFYVNGSHYYELTLTPADDVSSKYDRIIAYSKINIPDNYAVKLGLAESYITEFKKNVPVYIIVSWLVSIRPCEINNFGKLFNVNLGIQTANQEYKGLMNFLTFSGFNFSDLIKFENKLYEKHKSDILKNASVHKFFDLLDKIRQNYNSYNNIIFYLLYKMNNAIIKTQYDYNNYPISNDFYVSMKCLPFNEMPFVSSLHQHNPKFWDIFYSIGIKNHKFELIARFIKNNTEINGKLFTPKNELNYNELNLMIEQYNSKLYYKHINRKICYENNNYFIKGYVDDTYKIIKKILNLTSDGIDGFSNFADDWIHNNGYLIDDLEKKKIVSKIFSNSKVGIIYGAAGTGKSTLINHISNLLNSNKKIYLTNTNPAIENLKIKVKALNCTFSTVASFLSKYNVDRKCDVLFIDECSTISNKDILEILNTSTFKALVVTGDVYQIESIAFGNWFKMLKHFIDSSFIYELTTPYRTVEQKLINLWDSVRNYKNDIEEKLLKGKFSENISDDFFSKKDEDEMILCLNYNGVYGINNINKLLQLSNENQEIKLKDNIYKVGDPILFLDNDRFFPVLYNNLKGKIINIIETYNTVTFEIKIFKTITELDVDNKPIVLIKSDKNMSIIQIKINKYNGSSDDEDRGEDSIVPFQIAYAVSIHKSQGLEYDSVKIILTNDIEDLISHNIFYTAITRARKKLKIYWSPETQKRILSSFDARKSNKDCNLMAKKYNLRILNK